MNRKKLIDACIKLVDYAFNENANGFQVVIGAPDLGEIKCKFEYEIVLPEDSDD